MAILLLGYPLKTVEVPADLAAAIASGNPENVMALRLDYDQFESLQVLNTVRVLMESVIRAEERIKTLERMIAQARDALAPK